jgi:hypothetical protein
MALGNWYSCSFFDLLRRILRILIHKNPDFILMNPDRNHRNPEFRYIRFLQSDDAARHTAVYRYSSF